MKNTTRRPQEKCIGDCRKEKYRDKDTKTLRQRHVRDRHSRRHLDRNTIRKPQERRVGDCHRRRYPDKDTLRRLQERHIRDCRRRRDQRY